MDSVRRQRRTFGSRFDPVQELDKHGTTRTRTQTAKGLPPTLVETMHAEQQKLSKQVKIQKAAASQLQLNPDPVQKAQEDIDKLVDGIVDKEATVGASQTPRSRLGKAGSVLVERIRLLFYGNPAPHLGEELIKELYHAYKPVLEMILKKKKVQPLEHIDEKLLLNALDPSSLKNPEKAKQLIADVIKLIVCYEVEEAKQKASADRDATWKALLDSLQSAQQQVTHALNAKALQAEESINQLAATISSLEFKMDSEKKQFAIKLESEEHQRKRLDASLELEKEEKIKLAHQLWEETEAVKKWQKECEDLKKQVALLQLKNEGLTKQVQSKTEEITEKESQIKILEDKYNSLAKDIQQKQTQIDDLTDLIKDQKIDLENQKTLLGEQAKDLEQKQKLISELQDEIQTKQKLLTELQAELLQQKSKVDTLEKLVQQFTQELAGQKEQITSLTGQLEHIAQQNLAKDSLIEQLQTSADRILQQAQETINQTKMQVASAIHKAAQATQEAQAATKEIAKYKAEYEYYKQLYVKEQLQNYQLNEMYQETEKQYQSKLAEVIKVKSPKAEDDFVLLDGETIQEEESDDNKSVQFPDDDEHDM